MQINFIICDNDQCFSATCVGLTRTAGASWIKFTTDPFPPEGYHGCQRECVQRLLEMTEEERAASCAAVQARVQETTAIPASSSPQLVGC